MRPAGRRAVLLGALSSIAASCPPAQTRVNLDQQSGVFVAPVLIEGRLARMVLDTGAERSLLTRIGLARLKLPLDPWVGTTLRGAGGLLDQHQNAVAHSMSLGGVALYQRIVGGALSLPVADLPMGDIDGLLGSDVLRHHTLALDLPGRSLGLLPPEACGPGADVALRLLRHTLLLVTVMLDEAPLTALIDTGASVSQLYSRGAIRMKLSMTSSARDPAMASRGVGGDFTTHSHRFTTLQLGPMRVDQPALSVANVVSPSFDMLLGLDVLARQKINLSYAGASLTFG